MKIKPREPKTSVQEKMVKIVSIWGFENIIKFHKLNSNYPLAISGFDWSSMSKTVSARPPVFLTTGTWKTIMFRWELHPFLHSLRLCHVSAIHLYVHSMILLEGSNHTICTIELQLKLLIIHSWLCTRSSSENSTLRICQ